MHSRLKCIDALTVLPLLHAPAQVQYAMPVASDTSHRSDTARRRNLEYLDLDYFAILPEDYGGTSDRPQCEKGPSDQHYVSQVQACIVLDCTG